MKTLLRLCLFVGVMALTSSASAALNMYLKIEGAKGGSRVVSCVDGTCSLSDLAPGEYTVSACLENGQALPAEAAATHSISSPRDAASGQATGKRMHKPLRITKEWEASSPMLRIVVDEAGTPVVLCCKITKSRSNIQNN